MNCYRQSDVIITLFNQEVKAKRIVLPLPPSENQRLEVNYNALNISGGYVSMYKNSKINRGARVFRNSTAYNRWLHASVCMLKIGLKEAYTSDVFVHTLFVFPNNKSDPQNREKALYDAFTQSGCVYTDDKLVKKHYVTSMVKKGLSLSISYVIPLCDINLSFLEPSVDELDKIFKEVANEIQC